jgi:hypothetical protein
MVGFDISGIDPCDFITTILVMKMHFTVTSISAQNLNIFGIEDFCITRLWFSSFLSHTTLQIF